MQKSLEVVAAAIKTERDHWERYGENGRDERYRGALGALENLTGRVADTIEDATAHGTNGRAEFYAACGY